MSKQAHSPGPWSVDTIKGTTIYDRDFDYVADLAEGATDIEPRWQADARLMAAAPELLASLREMLPAMESRYDALKDRRISPLVKAEMLARLDRARSAIAKATGEA